MAVNRMDKVNSGLREVIAETLRKVKDPRLSSLISVVEVITSKDLKYAKVYVSLLVSDDSEKKSNMAALESAKGFIKKEVGSKIRMKSTPELVFIWDSSIERGTDLIMKINEVCDSGE